MSRVIVPYLESLLLLISRAAYRGNNNTYLMSRRPTREAQETDRSHDERERSRQSNREPAKKTGRPKKRERESESQDSFQPESTSQIRYEDDIQQAWMNFCHNVNEPKGFVFSAKDREKLQKKCHHYDNNVMIKWTDQHEWDPQTETQKVRQAMAQLEIEERPQVVTILRESCCITAQQVTNEFYRLILKVYQIFQNQKIEEARRRKQGFIVCQFHQERASQGGVDEQLSQLTNAVCHNVGNQFFFLSLKFKENVKDINACTSKKVDMSRSEAYRRLVNELADTVRQIVEKFG